MSSFTSVLLTACLAAPAPDWLGPDLDGDPGAREPALGDVEVPGALWRALQPEPEVEPGAMLLRRELTLTRVEGGVEVRARWILRSERAEWFANGLLGPDAHVRRVRWNGREAAVWSGELGSMVVERLEGTATLEVEAFVPGDMSGGIAVPMLGAPRGTVKLEGFAADVVLTGDERPVVLHGKGGTLSTGASMLRLASKPSEPHDRGPLVVASVGLGVTVGDAEVRGRARVRWEIRQGTRSSLSLSVRDVGEDLVVEGPLVSRWERAGGTVQVELAGEMAGLVDLELRWSVATPGGAEAKVALPVVVPLDVFRSPSAVQVARDGEVDVRPVLGGGWRPLASAQVPAWAEGLVEGSPTAAFVRARTSEGGDALELLRLEPVPGPPMVVDVADVHIAASDEGRMIVRARYEVRNERASHMVVTPPPGLRVVGVEVAGRRVTPGGDGRALRIPLKRSLETVRGSATVPVTVALLSDGTDEVAWARRERRELELPMVDAPVNVMRVHLRLPKRWRNKLREGEDAHVEEFDRGQEVGFGLDEPEKVAAADRLFSEAVEAWNANDFERAQERLDQLAVLGAGGVSIEGLQANVNLVRPRAVEAAAVVSTTGRTYDFDADLVIDDEMGGEEYYPSASMPPPPAQSSAVERRIRARARARSGDKKLELEGRKKKAKAFKDEGQYEAAAAEYREAIEQSKDLDRLEDEESVEYDYEAEALMEELAEVEAHNDSESDSAQEAVEDVADEEGEKDLVSGGIWLRVVGDDDDGDAGLDGLQGGEAQGAWGVGTLIKVPGDSWASVRYQHLLLEAGERRTVVVDAKRVPRRSW